VNLVKTEKKKKKLGGRREGSGRPSLFRGKSASADKPMFKHIVPPTTINITADARKILDDKSAELTREYKQNTKNKKARVSRNVIMEALLRKHGEKLTLGDITRLAAQ
jgi:hypothetical protein